MFCVFLGRVLFPILKHGNIRENISSCHASPVVPRVPGEEFGVFRREIGGGAPTSRQGQGGLQAWLILKKRRSSTFRRTTKQK